MLACLHSLIKTKHSTFEAGGECWKGLYELKFFLSDVDVTHLELGMHQWLNIGIGLSTVLRRTHFLFFFFPEALKPHCTRLWHIMSKIEQTRIQHVAERRRV